MASTLILTFGILILFFVGLGIRILFLKDGEFKGTCASQSPFLKNQIGECTVCGKTPEEECRWDEMEEAKVAIDSVLKKT